MSFIYKKRADFYANRVLPFIKENEKVLDIGAGNGVIAKVINKKADVTLVDVIDYNQTDLTLIIYNGKTLPFPDNHFDTSLLVAVLHHTEYPEELLKEAKRVSKRLIIVEEVYTTRFGKLFLSLWDWFFNIATKAPLYFNFHSKKEWNQIFNRLGLTMVDNCDFRNALLTLKMNMYILVK